MHLLIDNYDSFTFNLFQMIESLGSSCRVVRNDRISLQEISNLKPESIILSPGPGDPSEAGVTLEVIRSFSGKIPIFGVCLGHQAIGHAFGGKVVRAKKAMHGKISRIFHKKKGVFANAPEPFFATRYHSLIVDRETLPRCLEITSETEDGLIMGLRHRKFKVEGVQFHPESIATEGGVQLLKTFLIQTKRK